MVPHLHGFRIEGPLRVPALMTQEMADDSLLYILKKRRKV